MFAMILILHTADLQCSRPDFPRHHPQISLTSRKSTQEAAFIAPHLAQVHHSLSIKLSHCEQIHPIGFDGCFDIVASRDMIDFTAFLALLSRIEVGMACVDGVVAVLLGCCGAWGDKDEVGLEKEERGRSVEQASQTR